MARNGKVLVETLESGCQMFQKDLVVAGVVVGEIITPEWPTFDSLCTSVANGEFRESDVIDWVASAADLAMRAKARGKLVVSQKTYDTYLDTVLMKTRLEEVMNKRRTTATPEFNAWVRQEYKKHLDKTKATPAEVKAANETQTNEAKA